MRPPRYINAGPLPVAASPRAVAASGSAVESMGKTIAAVGDIGLQMAGKVRRIDEATRIADAFATMEKQASDFSLSLMGREDTTEWTKEWADLSRSFSDLPQVRELSPEARAQFQMRLTNWNTDRTIHLETIAANKTVELGKARLENAFRTYKDTKNYDGIRELIDSAPPELLSGPDRERLLYDTQVQEDWDFQLDRIEEDPHGWIRQNTEPPPGIPADKFDQLRSHARTLARQNDIVNSEDILNRIVTGEITDRDGIDKLAFDLSPTKKLSLYSTLDRWNEEKAAREMADPATIRKNIGSFYATLADWNPDDEAMDADAVQLRYLIESVPDGPLRDQMETSFRATRNRYSEEVDATTKAIHEAGKTALHTGAFGTFEKPTPGKLPVKQALDSGWLTNNARLERAGFSPAVAQEIATVAREQGNPAAAALLKKNWKNRNETNAAMHPADIAIANAIRLENAYANWETPPAPEAVKAYDSTLTEYGKFMEKMEAFRKANPTAKPAEIEAEIARLAGAKARRAYQQARTTPRPDDSFLPPFDESTTFEDAMVLPDLPNE